VSRVAILGLFLLAGCDRKTEAPAVNTDRTVAERQAIAKADADVRASETAAR